MGSLALQEELIIVFVMLAIVVLYILFLLTLQKALKIISPENRKMKPGIVWSFLIPIVGVVLMFMVANDIATGFKREFDRCAVFKQGKPTYGLGLTLAILVCVYYAVNFFVTDFLLTGLTAWAIIITWIVYWVQVNKTKNELVKLKAMFNLEPGEKSIFV